MLRLDSSLPMGEMATPLESPTLLSGVQTRILPLGGFGVPSTAARIEVRTLSRSERFRRGGVMLLVGLVAAVVSLPIPIVHLVFPPVALVAGFALGVRRGLRREVFQKAIGRCPFCGLEQRLNLAGATYRLPQALKCKSCNKLLTLEAA
jgi:hypothetical protein